MTEPLRAEDICDQILMGTRQQLALGGILAAQREGLPPTRAKELAAEVLAGNIDEVYNELEEVWPLLVSSNCL
ncbi:MAG TPA: hypothetical protein VMW29_02770 [Candidatus Bathyarchaeia archaeon]|nr:hypothetical protein [Candidatus Bathyarchaeia archaeon]